MPDPIVNPEAMTGDAYFDARKSGAKVAVAAEPDPPPAPPDDPPAEPADPPAEPAPELAPEPVDEPTAEPEPPAEPEPAPPPQAKVDPRTKKIREQEQEIAALRAREAERDARMERLLAAVEARQQPAPVETKPAETPPQPAPRPVREAFDDPTAYDEALIEWSAQRALNVSQAETARRAAEAKAAEDKAAADKTTAEQAAALDQAYKDRRTAFIETHPDYEEVAESQAVRINDAMGFVIVRDPKGPEMAYYLGQNPQEAARLAQITDAGELLMEFGAIKAKLAIAAAVAARPQVSRAPRPIVPVGSRSTAATVDPETQTGDEYFEANVGKYRAARAGVGRVN